MTGPIRSKALAALVRTLKAGVIAVGVTTGSIGAYWGVVQYQGNFHTVAEGAFYRSAQLTKEELQRAVHDHGIKAILNLRGAHPGEPWYDDEVAVSREVGATHYDYGLSAYRSRRLAFAREEMEKKSGRRSVPQIFIGEQHVGGSDDLHALDRAGALDPLLGK